MLQKPHSQPVSSGSKLSKLSLHADGWRVASRRSLITGRWTDGRTDGRTPTRAVKTSPVDVNGNRVRTMYSASATRSLLITSRMLSIMGRA